MTTKLLTLALVLAALLFCVWKFWLPLSANQAVLRLPGTVEIDDVRLGSKVTGRVKSVLVKEGETVRPGQTLVELDVPELRAQRDGIESQIYAADAQLRKWKAGPREEEKLAAHASVQAAAAKQRRLIAGPRSPELDQARAEVEAIAADLEQATRNMKRMVDLAPSKATTANELELARAAQGRLTGQLHAAQARLKLLELGTRTEELQEAQFELVRLTANAALLDAGSRPEEIEAAAAYVDELRAKQRELELQIDEATIKAPSVAVVEVLAVRPGDILAAAECAVRVLEPDQMWVKAYVSEVDLGKIRLNQAVEVSIDAYPNRRFPGTITFIANTSEFTPRNVQTVNERRYQVFAVKVTVRDSDKVFKSGLAADVWVTTK